MKMRLGKICFSIFAVFSSLDSSTGGAAAFGRTSVER